MKQTTQCKKNSVFCLYELNYCFFSCLAKFALPLNVGQPSALSVSYDLSTIVVGCSDGNLVRFHLTFEQIELLRSASEGQEKERVKTVHPEIIYPNGSEWHEGYVDDVHILGQDNGPKNELSNHIGKMKALVVHYIIIRF